MLNLRCIPVCLWLAVVVTSAQTAESPVDLGTVTERHEMVPMRDGKKLSTYLYIPAGKGPWPVLYEQRYADLRGAETRKGFARLAESLLSGGFIARMPTYEDCVDQSLVSG